MTQEIGGAAVRRHLLAAQGIQRRTLTDRSGLWLVRVRMRIVQ